MALTKQATADPRDPKNWVNQPLSPETEKVLGNIAAVTGNTGLLPQASTAAPANSGAPTGKKRNGMVIVLVVIAVIGVTVWLVMRRRKKVI